MGFERAKTFTECMSVYGSVYLQSRFLSSKLGLLYLAKKSSNILIFKSILIQQHMQH